jgi:tRNA1Val (adenine37-N6)-methyltransferase
MKVTTDSCLFGAWCAFEIRNIKPKVHTLLDIGTGTGLLSLLIAQKNDLKIEAVEIDMDATQQAKENIASSPWKQNIRVSNSDILSLHHENKFDCIVSNPPFYEKELTSQQHKKNIAYHSTQLNLSELFSIIEQDLYDNGFFFLLLPYKRVKESETLLKEKHLYVEKKVEVQQSVLHTPFRIMLMGSRQKPKEVLTSKMSICDKEQQYTPEFIALLKDYYLYL